MNAPDFSAWVRQRDDQRRRHVPDADRVVPLIAQAGATGMTRTQLGHALSLEPAALDALLDGLVQAGMISRAGEAGNLVFRTRQTPSAGSPAGIAGANNNAVYRQ